MDILNNPFHVLSATTRDNRNRIVELADEKSLLSDSNSFKRASTDLTNPRKRLAAEVSWLPGLRPNRVNEVLSQLDNAELDIFDNENFIPITKANLFASIISRIKNPDLYDMAGWITNLSWEFENIEPREIHSIINEDRIVAGFPEVADISLVEKELQERRLHYRKVIQKALDNLYTEEMVQAITLVVESATDDGESQGAILIDDIVDYYEVHAQDFLVNEAENIIEMVENIREAADGSMADEKLASMVPKLISAVKQWDTVAQPIQVSTKSRGLNHKASSELAILVRSLAIDLYNEHEKLELSQKITSMLQEVFAEVVEVAELTAEDASTLNNIAEERERIVRESKEKEEEWRKEISYEAEVGAFRKQRLSISPDGIEWKGHIWGIETINRLRWGGTQHSVNSISTGTTYHILIGNNVDSTEIDLRNKVIYKNFVDRLWKAVGVRILTECLVGLSKGEELPFGEAVIEDTGMILEKKKWFGENERIFCPWSELVIWNEPGCFCIGVKNDKKISASFSYQNEDNIHVLEAAIRMFWKKSGDKISGLLGD